MTYKKKKLILCTCGVILAIAFALTIKFQRYNRKPDLSMYKEVVVRRVVDGDTFVYMDSENEIRVRLIGIDCPESVAPEESGKKNTEEGKIASAYTKKLIEGKTVFLEYDVDPLDNFGRELCYVYLSDGRMLQNILLEEGYARTMTIQPNSKYVDFFVHSQQAAINEKKGFWDGFFIAE